MEERGLDHSQVWFTVRKPKGGCISLVFDEKIHGREKVLEMVEKVSSHTAWHNWAIEAASTWGLFHPVTEATFGMVDIRHDALPLDLQPNCAVSLPRIVMST